MTKGARGAADEAGNQPAAAGASASGNATCDQPAPLVIMAHASVGSGHRSAANAIAQALELLRDNPAEDANAAIPANLQVEVLDMLDFGRIRFDGDKTASLFTGATRPVYDIAWRYNFTGRVLWGGGTGWSHVMFPAFIDHVRARQPLAVICTHITAANVAVGARALAGQRFPIVCVPTDYEIEGMWPHLYADLFCVANEHMAETLRARHVPDESLLITGLPTRLAFRRDPTPEERTLTRATLGLPRDKRLTLVLAGANLPRPYVLFRETLEQTLPHLKELRDTHFAFIAGHDGEYAAHLREQCAAHGTGNVTVFEYVEDIASLMAASDLAVCKAGGLTVTECLCARTPMVLVGKAYGQEKANARMLTSAGAALHVTTARELLALLRHVEEHPESAQAMLVNASFLRKPNAATDIAAAALRLAMTNGVSRDRMQRLHFLKLYRGDKPAHLR